MLYWRYKPSTPAGGGEKARHDGKAELVIITENVEERRICDALTILQGMSMVREISGMIRVYG